MRSSNRVLINSSAQYIRAIVNIVLSLIATRLILRILGVEDYGIYTLVAGVVSILSFITNSLIITTQRYLSVTQGENDEEKSKVIFNNSNILHLSIGLVVVLILELISPLLFNGFLNIPENRLFAAKALYHSIAIIIFLTLITSPYRAVLTSHENIVYISIIEIIDSFLKLFVAFILYNVSYDKLIVYGVSLIGIQIFNLATLSIYASVKYKECIFIKVSLFNILYIKKLASFAGWTMLNLICNVGRIQGISILLNKYVGPTINAAYGLGFQVSGALGLISQSILNAMNPQLMKAEGAGNRYKMLRFAEIECKFSFFFLSAVSIPCLYEMPRLLEIWLDNVPAYAVLFCRMVILAALSDNITAGLGSANQAVGNIRNYTIAFSLLKLLALPISIVLLLLDYNIFAIAATYVIIEFISSIIRIPFLQKTAKLNILSFINNVIYKEVFPLIVIILSCTIITCTIESLYRFILTFTLSIALYCITIYKFGLCDDEKQIIVAIINRLK